MCCVYSYLVLFFSHFSYMHNSFLSFMSSFYYNYFFPNLCYPLISYVIFSVYFSSLQFSSVLQVYLSSMLAVCVEVILYFYSCFFIQSLYMNFELDNFNLLIFTWNQSSWRFRKRLHADSSSSFTELWLLLFLYDVSKYGGLIGEIAWLCHLPHFTSPVSFLYRC